MTVSELHRYPVKSMLGESLAEVHVDEQGIMGDRAWALRSAGSTLSGKKHPALMSAQASFTTQPSAETRSAAVTITLPDGTQINSAEADSATTLSAWLNAEAKLWPLVSADHLEFFQRKAQGDVTPEQVEAELRHVFSRLPSEPLPDLASFPEEVLHYETPPGTYFDAFPILLVSTASLETLGERATNNFDMRRFRPNIVVSGLVGDFPENDLVGKRCAIGETVLAVEMPCPRCIMTTHPFAEVPKDPNVMRQLVTHNHGNLGVYAKVIKSGKICRGDKLEVLS